jgi:aminopeptidase N
VTFQINVTENNFAGNVKIEVEAKEDVEYFILHAAEILNVTDTRVFKNSTNEEITVNKTFRYIPYEFWAIQLENKVSADTYRLELQFNGDLNQNMVGIYKSNYIRDGQIVGLAATQFQSTHARKAFPCFDEPSFKSVFDVTIIRDSHLDLTISNMPNISQSIDDTNGWVTTKYQETVPMVTYLLALVVSDFVCKETDENGYPLRVCSSSVEEYKLNYSLEMAPKLLNHYAVDYLDSPYQLPKVDFIAIPDFSAGAMENWGLITFRETAMLYTDSESTSTNKMSVIAVIAHEIAHMVYELNI